MVDEHTAPITETDSQCHVVKTDDFAKCSSFQFVLRLLLIGIEAMILFSGNGPIANSIAILAVLSVLTWIAPHAIASCGCICFYLPAMYGPMSRDQAIAVAIAVGLGVGFGIIAIRRGPSVNFGIGIFALAGNVIFLCLFAFHAISRIAR